MQGRQGDAFFDTGNHVVIDQHRFAVKLATAHHAVADGGDAVAQAVGFELVQKCFYCAGVVGLVFQIDGVFFAVDFKRDKGIGQNQLVAQAAEQHFAGVVIQHGTLHR